MYKGLIKRIDGSGLCLGCGLCGSISAGRIEFSEGADGFFHPNAGVEISRIAAEAVSAVCPGINTCFSDDRLGQGEVWGRVDGCFSGWSNDEVIRRSASSGGLVSALAAYMLDAGIVDAVLHVGADEENCLSNRLHISSSVDEVLSRASSRYAPALVFLDVLEILERDSKKYLFIGKPCDVASLRLLLREYPKYENRVHACFSIFCAGMPSINGTREILDILGVKERPISLRYRGNGWPGAFCVVDSSRVPHEMSYNDSWGKVLGKYIHFRCKICPDGSGKSADISFGDAWATNDGYPDFEERDGKSLVLSRTALGRELLCAAVAAGRISLSDLSVESIKEMQPYQYLRAVSSGWRLAAVRIATLGLIRRPDASVRRAMRYFPLQRGIRQFAGTMKRFYKHD
jgi:coenzyme F420 hydrogenase subunit beta